MFEASAPWQAGAFGFSSAVRGESGRALGAIEAGFQGEVPQIRGSHAAAWVVVDVLERRYGAAGWDRPLKSLGRARSLDDAMRSAHGIRIEGLDAMVADSLR